MPTFRHCCLHKGKQKKHSSFFTIRNSVFERAKMCTRAHVINNQREEKPRLILRGASVLNPHLLDLSDISISQARFYHRNMHIFNRMTWTIQMLRHRKVSLVMKHIKTMFREAICQSASCLANVDGFRAFNFCSAREMPCDRNEFSWCWS